MSASVRWIIAGVAAVLIVCLVIWARGLDHHRGDDVGSLGSAWTFASV